MQLHVVTPVGFEPTTLGAEILRSIQLSYEAICDFGKIRTYNLHIRSVVLYPVELRSHIHCTPDRARTCDLKIRSFALCPSELRGHM